jgi:hypothetical protein
MPATTPLSDAQAQRLIRLYGDAEAEILTECNRLLLKNPESYSLAWKKTILARVQEIRKQLLAGSRTWTSEAIADSYMKGMQWADKDPLTGNKVLAGFGKIHEQAVEVLADNAYSRLQDVNSVIGRRVDDVFRTVALEHAKGSVIGYQTTKQVAKRIREDLAEKGITGFVDKAGHAWDMRRYAQVLAVETTKEAFRQGTINRLQEKSHDLVRLSTHSGSCKRCIPFQGRTFSLSGGDKEFPSLDEARAGGVFHVGCLHVVSLAPEELDRFLVKLQGNEGEAARQVEIDRLAAKGGWKPEEAPKPKVADFVPASDIDRARSRFAQMGVRFHDVTQNDFTKGSGRLDIANHALEWAERRKAAGYPMPGGIRIDPNEFKAWNGKPDTAIIARVDAKTHDIIHINSNSAHWLDPLGNGKKEAAGKWTESESTLDHEMGHLLNWRESPDIAKKLSKADPTGAVSDALKSQISRYGGTSPMEFVAEVYSGRISGKSYSAEVLKAYEKWGGPKI